MTLVDIAQDILWRCLSFARISGEDDALHNCHCPCRLWLLGLVTSYTMGGFIHLLLVIAIVVILIRVIQGRRAV